MGQTLTFPQKPLQGATASGQAIIEKQLRDASPFSQPATEARSQAGMQVAEICPAILSVSAFILPIFTKGVDKVG
jgi:hypothetical protein